jgi:hypothetical protein
MVWALAAPGLGCTGKIRIGSLSGYPEAPAIELPPESPAMLGRIAILTDSGVAPRAGGPTWSNQPARPSALLEQS